MASAKKRRGSRRGSSGSVASVIGLGLLLVSLVGAGVTVYLKGIASAVKTDPETLCRVDHDLANVTAVIIDASDELTGAQRLDISNRLGRVRNDIPEMGLLEIYVVNGDPEQIIKPALALCNPGSGEAMNKLYQNPAQARKRWERDFKERVDRALIDAFDAPKLETSPLLEAIRSVALLSFGSEGRFGARHKLIIASDMIHNVPGKLNQYNEKVSFKSFAKSAYYSSIRASLEGASVSILYLRRTSINNVQGAEHISFWSDYFQEQAAEVVRVDSIYGAQ